MPSTLLRRAPGSCPSALVVLRLALSLLLIALPARAGAQGATRATPKSERSQGTSSTRAAKPAQRLASRPASASTTKRASTSSAKTRPATLPVAAKVEDGAKGTVKVASSARAEPAAPRPTARTARSTTKGTTKGTTKSTTKSTTRKSKPTLRERLRSSARAVRDGATRPSLAFMGSRGPGRPTPTEDAPATDADLSVMREVEPSGAWPLARRLISAAREHLGTRYVWGGSTPGGFDCSGFTKYVFAHLGIPLPRTSREQVSRGQEVPPHARWLRPGDLLFFSRSPGEPISHVGIYAGDNRIIHASASGKSVRFDDLTTRRGRWFANHMVAARRVLPGDAAAPVEAGDDTDAPVVSGGNGDADFLRRLGAVKPNGTIKMR